MKNKIDEYMDKVSFLLDNTTDPFAMRYKTELLESIEHAASQNWLDTGDPILTKEQLLEIHNQVKESVGDRSWEILGNLNINVN